MVTVTGLAKELSGVRPPVRRASHLPGRYYTTDEVYQLEKERIFLRDWLCVGREEEISKPGDYLALSIVDNPIVAVRDGSGKRINAFSAVCRHRGALVAGSNEKDRAGSVKLFKCPFHAWTYGLDGRLMNAPFMDESEGFNKDENGLIPLKVDTWGGFVFVNFDTSNASTFIESMGDFASGLEEMNDTYHLNELRIAKSSKQNWIFDCNWKLLTEQTYEHYHASLLHGDKVDNILGDFQDKFYRNGGMLTHYRAAPITPDGKTRVGNISWLSDKMLESGIQVVIWPNIIIHGSPDMVLYQTAWPMGADKALYDRAVLFEGKAVENPNFEAYLKVYQDFNSEIFWEDIDAVVSTMRGMRSTQYVPGRLSYFEVALNNAFEYYLNRLGQKNQLA